MAGIKGTVFNLVVEELQRALAAGAVAPGELAALLRPEELPLVEERPLASGWYPVDLYDRVNRLLRDAVGGGQDAWLVEQGRRTARRLVADGYYSATHDAAFVGLAGGKTPAERHRRYGAHLSRMVSLSASILDFSRWAIRGEPGRPLRYEVEVAEAADFPEVLCWRTQGFMNELSRIHGPESLWRWERPAPDVVRYRMTQEL